MVSGFPSSSVSTLIAVRLAFRLASACRFVSMNCSRSPFSRIQKCDSTLIWSWLKYLNRSVGPGLSTAECKISWVGTSAGWVRFSFSGRQVAIGHIDKF